MQLRNTVHLVLAHFSRKSQEDVKTEVEVGGNMQF